MDHITEDTLRKAGSVLSNLDTVSTGVVHTVTITLDGASGGALCRIESELAEDITTVIR